MALVIHRHFSAECVSLFGVGFRFVRGRFRFPCADQHGFAAGGEDPGGRSRLAVGAVAVLLRTVVRLAALASGGEGGRADRAGAGEPAAGPAIVVDTRSAGRAAAAEMPRLGIVSRLVIGAASAAAAAAGGEPAVVADSAEAPLSGSAIVAAAGSRHGHQGSKQHQLKQKT